ncbi:MFS transporter [Halocatena marina]|uniref:MFS transporter n=1 Tax=Halocatena marina TaxID=2934937 RepID=UPI00200D964F|nr:MFS transporter [Halocatena marina]
MRALKSLLYRFYAYRLLTSEGFVYPILTVHALAQGLDLAGVGLAAGTFFLGTLVGEIPTGYIGDRLGRRNGLALGAVLVSLTHVGFAVADSLVGFVLCWSFWGVAATFRSGSTDAWLYDTLVDADETSRYTEVRGRSTSVFYVAAAVTALCGGLLYEYWTFVPFAAAAVMTALGGMLVLTLPEPDSNTSTEGFSPAEAVTALTSVLTTRQLRVFVVLSAVVLAVPETIEIFVQPVALSVGVTTELLGPLYTGLMIAAAVGSSLAAPISERFSIGAWFTLGTVGLTGVLLLASALPVVAVPVFFVARSANTVSDTLGSTYLNNRLDSQGRATALSGVSMVQALVFVFARSTGGALAVATTPMTSLAVLGMVAVFTVLLLRVLVDPFESQTARLFTSGETT